MAFRVVVVAGLVGALAMVPLGLALTATGFEVNGRPFPWIARA